ncbi:MAG: histidine phosphatase family protein [Rhodobacteraceae bacterium CG17_big_fil_post_rev_8_21_14_2_50_63_15]|nr:histidine phosphatase family protein [Roseovarius sp.]PIV77638.1 MAG: histidine phosphatase family protein [Rhodobacteraceae bacterium CG17_big_fil_post_rev_8_21_14_2_50_63_15]
MTRIFWVRHGPTHAKTMVGWSDVQADLSDAPRLARLSAHLPQEALVISSDLCRARATADAIAGTRRRLPDDADLREIHFGAWELQAFDAIPDQTRLHAFWDQPGDVRPPGGESWHDLSTRVARAIARLRAAHPGRDIVAVAHLGVILTQVQGALGLSAYDAFSHRIDTLSVTEMNWRDGVWHARAINYQP